MCLLLELLLLYLEVTVVGVVVAEFSLAEDVADLTDSQSLLLEELIRKSILCEEYFFIRV